MWKEAEIFRVRKIFEDGGKDHKPRNVGDLEKLKKASKEILPWNLQKEWSPIDTLIVSSERLISNFWAPNYKITNLLETTVCSNCYTSNKKLTHGLTPGCQDRYWAQAWEGRVIRVLREVTYDWVLKDEQSLGVGVPRSRSSICKGPVLYIQAISRHLK